MSVATLIAHRAGRMTAGAGRGMIAWDVDRLVLNPGFEVK